MIQINHNMLIIITINKTCTLNEEIPYSAMQRFHVRHWSHCSRHILKFHTMHIITNSFVARSKRNQATCTEQRAETNWDGRRYRCACASSRSISPTRLTPLDFCIIDSVFYIRDLHTVCQV